jgi:hypothetical protein
MDSTNSSWLWWVIGIVAFIVVVVFAYMAFWPQVLTTTTPSVQGTTTASSVGWPVYTDTAHGFSVSYPPDFTVNTNYHYTNSGPGKETNGVSFTIPASMAAGTNLGGDSYVSVEYTSGTTCTAANFLDNGQELPDPGDTVYQYDVQTTTGAAAGNRYEEIVFALPDCRAVRYFIHSSVLENYPAGTVQAFDRDHLIQLFDLVRKSLVEDRKG